MVRVFLIRHAEPRAHWGGDEHNPGLSETGHAQAAAAAAALAGLGDLAACSSPLRRCVETASPYVDQRGVALRYDPRVGEVTAPADIVDRRAWLMANFPFLDPHPSQRWGALDPQLHAWRAQVLNAVRELGEDTAIFSHFIAINALVGAALGRDETIVCRPAHASITELALSDAALSLVRLGAQMDNDDVR